MKQFVLALAQVSLLCGVPGPHSATLRCLWGWRMPSAPRFRDLANNGRRLSEAPCPKDESAPAGHLGPQRGVEHPFQRLSLTEIALKVHRAVRAPCPEARDRREHRRTCLTMHPPQIEARVRR